jgi:hypothetical protein
MDDAAIEFWRGHTNGSGSWVIVDKSGNHRTLCHSGGDPGRPVTFFLTSRDGNTSTMLEDALRLSCEDARYIIQASPNILSAVTLDAAYRMHIRDGGPVTRELPA